MDIDSAWDDITLMEERASNAGFVVGLRVGQDRAKAPAFGLGLRKGIQIGREVGYYAGFASVHVKDLRSSKDSSAKQTKALAALDWMKRAADDFPEDNIVDEDVLERLHAIRAKHKLICSLLGLKAADVSTTTSGSTTTSW
jgi:hypothetical protein